MNEALKIHVICDKSYVNLEGSATSLRELSDTIQNLDGMQTFGLSIPVKLSGQCHVYVKLLKLVECNENVRVTCSKDEMIISGSKEKMAILARNILRLAEQSDNNSGNYRSHVHIEYHPGHFYLMKDSLPLIVTKQLGTE